MDKKSLTPMILGLAAIAVLVYWHATKETDPVRSSQVMAQSGKVDQSQATEESPAAVPVDGKYPQISIEEMTHDFGVVPQGTDVTHIFKVRNTGEAPLNLLSAKAP